MIDILNKKQLREQLKANQISFSIKSDEEELRQILKDAIESGKAQLQNFETEDVEESEEQKEEQEEIEVKEEIIVEGEQASYLQCFNQLIGKNFRG